MLVDACDNRGCHALPVSIRLVCHRIAVYGDPVGGPVRSGPVRSVGAQVGGSVDTSSAVFEFALFQSEVLPPGGPSGQSLGALP